MEKNEFEEIENNEEDFEEDISENDDQKKEDQKNVIKLDYNMDSIERLKIEIENSKEQNEKIIGEYLLNQFKIDEVLKNAYKERKITLSAIGKFVYECAKKELNSKNGMIADSVVYGWVLHFVQDEPVKLTEAETYELTLKDKDEAKKRAIKAYEAQELEKIKKAEQRKIESEKRKVEKDLQKEKDSGQMNLFEGLL